MKEREALHFLFDHIVLKIFSNSIRCLTLNLQKETKHGRVKVKY